MGQALVRACQTLPSAAPVGQTLVCTPVHIATVSIYPGPLFPLILVSFSLLLPSSPFLIIIDDWPDNQLSSMMIRLSFFLSCLHGNQIELPASEAVVVFGH